jgi:hypothetical protein
MFAGTRYVRFKIMQHQRQQVIKCAYELRRLADRADQGHQVSEQDFMAPMDQFWRDRLPPKYNATAFIMALQQEAMRMYGAGMREFRNKK